MKFTYRLNDTMIRLGNLEHPYAIINTSTGELVTRAINRTDAEKKLSDQIREAKVAAKNCQKCIDAIERGDDHVMLTINDHTRNTAVNPENLKGFYADLVFYNRLLYTRQNRLKIVEWWGC